MNQVAPGVTEVTEYQFKGDTEATEFQRRQPRACSFLSANFASRVLHFVTLNSMGAVRDPLRVINWKEVFEDGHRHTDDHR